MTEDERARIEAACIRLQQRYGTLADRQDPAFRELFTEDATITLPEFAPFAGLDAIMAGQAQWRQSGVVMRHVCTNFTIKVEDEDHASGICYLMVFRHDGTAPPAGDLPVPQASSLGEFHDSFVRQNASWRFKRRTLHRIMQLGSAL